ncbi:T9SS type B sorting domain-containing protein [Mesonia mobilis]|uniref:T9SS type B sorting domain-containing protein n=1 Tax=Mesonia mobilis TaxID=369791 RepID=UPI0024B976F5|nr:T9SS type B sorting domain-containing protein [Mesonia mobilis]
MKYLFSLIILIFCSAQLSAQQPNDCVNAIVICGNSSFSSNASGAGVQEVSGCASEEHNSIWIRVDIVQNGTLGFDLIPDNTDISVDYDFWIYGPNEDCSSLTSPIRCSTTNPIAAGQTNNHTGMGSVSSEAFEGPGADGDSYVEWINVLSGESYYIVVDRPVGNGGFELNWTGSAAQGTGAFPEPPTANMIQDLEECSDTGSAQFNLGNLRSSINSDLSNNEVDFYETLANATDNLNALPNNYTSSQSVKTIYAKVTSNSTQCTNVTEFNLIINQIDNIQIEASENPICAPRDVEIQFSGSANAIVEYEIDGGSTQQIQLNNSGIATFNLFVDEEVTISVSNTYVENPDGSIQCSAAQNESLTILVEGISVGENLIDFYTCDGDQDGKAIFDLTENDSIALANVSGGYQTSYHFTQAQAENGTNAIATPANFENTQNFPQEIWVRVEDEVFTNCYAVSSFELDAYTDAPPSFEVERSSLNFGEEHVITITNVSGIGIYEFSIGNGNWQLIDDANPSISFTVEGGGQFTVTGRHTEGCGMSFQTVTFIDYPKYFTPNQDGINDYWNIVGFQQNNRNAEILIFDRFGKLLKSIAPNSRGWDGTYHGKSMPSNDYWFLVNYVETLPDGTTINKSFKSNFSLIR